MADDLKNLQPEDRIKKLKELEQQKKKEIEEAHKQIRDSERELTEKQKIKEKIPIPQVARQDLKDLTAEEQDIIRTHRGLKKEEKKSEVEEKIEKADKKSKESADLEFLAREKVDLPLQLMQSEYTLHLSQRPMHDLYSEMTKINQAVEDKGYVNAEEQRRVQYLSSAVERKLDDIESGKYSFNEDVALAASLVQQMGAKLRDVYHRGKGEKNSMYQG